MAPISMVARYSLWMGDGPVSISIDDMLLGCFKPQNCDNLLGAEQGGGGSGDENNSFVPAEQNQPQCQPPAQLQEVSAKITPPSATPRSRTGMSATLSGM